MDYINNVKVIITPIAGNLYVVTIPETKDESLRKQQTDLYTILRTKCGGAKPDMFTEKLELPSGALLSGTSLVFTHDAYTHLIPFYCDLCWGKN